MPLALLSVYDKTGIADFARGLVEAGWDVLSSGGTAGILRDAGVPVTDVAEVTGYPAILGHRVVTLHPAVHGGILADLDNAEHRSDLEAHGIRPIDLVVVNLYPFTADPSIDLIDIGGPALIRAAAKNHSHVSVVTAVADYAPVLAAITVNGSVGPDLRRDLARRAFALTADYDARIARWFTVGDDGPSSIGPGEDGSDPTGDLPDHLILEADAVRTLRYGENPHQRGALYRIRSTGSWWDSVQQHGGKDLSYLNVHDTEASWRLVHQFSDPACVIVKHANPCGVAASVTGNVAEVHRLALACDPVSAFGGIVAVNRPVDADAARQMHEVFTEVIVAPSFTEEALSILTSKSNLRLLSGPPPIGNALEVRSVDGGLLVQTPDRVSLDRSGWTVVTKHAPTADQWSDLEFAWVVSAFVSSNAIVVARDRQAIGIGAGQQNRLDSARLAVERAA
ncbi:MAG: bifunctional phosphoribosylaminoimidazolecarboxamide formyltransferase/IMP cyclohydrolase, partial [Ilumatobacteraceae bacterium]